MDNDRRLPALTGLRGIAALWVLVFHAWALAGGRPAGLDSPWSLVASAGWLGVDVFFVLSGFLLTRALLQRDGASSPAVGGVDWRGFALRRAARILPAYHVQLLVLGVLGVLGSSAIGWRPDGFADLGAHAVLWLNAWPWVPAHLGPWWSLAVEVLFYATLPLVLPGLRSMRGAALLVVAAGILAVLWRWGIHHLAGGIEQRIGWTEHAPGRWVQFVAGAVLARACAGHPPVLRPWKGDAMLVAAVLALVALPHVAEGRAYNGIVDGRWWTWCWPLATTLPVAALLWALLAAPRSALARLLAGRVLQGVGRVSFSLYLWHYPVQWGLREAWGGHVADGWALAGFTGTSLVLSLAVAGLSWWAVERPALNAARRWRARLAAPERSAS